MATMKRAKLRSSNLVAPWLRLPGLRRGPATTSAFTPWAARSLSVWLGAGRAAAEAAPDVLRCFDVTAPHQHEGEKRHVLPVLLASADAALQALAVRLKAEYQAMTTAQGPVCGRAWRSWPMATGRRKRRPSSSAVGQPLKRCTATIRPPGTARPTPRSRSAWRRQCWRQSTTSWRGDAAHDSLAGNPIGQSRAVLRSSKSTGGPYLRPSVRPYGAGWPQAAARTPLARHCAISLAHLGRAAARWRTLTWP